MRRPGVIDSLFPLFRRLKEEFVDENETDDDDKEDE